MKKLSNKNIKRLIWVISTVICCLLIYFVCLPFYQDSIDSGGKIEGAWILIAFIFTISLVFIIFLISYVTALFLIDCLRLSQQTLIRNKITGVLTIIIILILIISPMVNFEKLRNKQKNDLYQAFVYYLIFPMTVILLSRFAFQKIKNYPILLGLVSLIVFNIFGFLYLNLTKAGMGGVDYHGMGFSILFESIAVCIISIVVNLIERKKIKTISGRVIK